MTSQIFPSILIPYAEGWKIKSKSRTGGETIVATQQFAPIPNGLWMAKLGFYLTSPDNLLEARGFLAGLDGQAGEFLIGPYDYRGAPWNIDDLTGGLYTPDVAGSDPLGAFGFSLADDVGANSVSFSMSRSQSGPVQRGQYLSIGEDLHIITDVPGGDGGGTGNVSVTIRPWTRQAWGVGQSVEFARPVCRMRLASEDTGMINLTTSPLSDLSLDIIEAR